MGYPVGRRGIAGRPAILSAFRGIPTCCGAISFRPPMRPMREWHFNCAVLL